MTAVTAILNFWFDAVGPTKWFVKDPELDREIGHRFGAIYWQAAAGNFDLWRHRAPSCLALIILLDQFPRNLFRASGRCFTTDAKARSLTRHALEYGLDRQVPAAMRQFFYMPLQHSEAIADQELCVAIAERDLAGTKFHNYAVQHLEVVRRFGRFPHRNAILKRPSTEDEQTFLDRGGASF